jgi:enoyl-CoA hydratase/carnithine racemase
VNAPLDVRREGAVAVVTLNRPEKRNALSLELREQFAAALDDLGQDDDSCCVLLTGAGSAFCSGMDVSEFGGERANRERIVELSVAAFRALGACPKPVVAAVNGPAIAGGFALALLCDVRIGSEDARLGFAEPPGVPPSYAAARAALPAALARELTLTGRILDALEAIGLGVLGEVTTADDLLPRALTVAERIAAAPAARITKSRILLEREHLHGPLFAEEERLLRDALLGGDQ